MLTGCRFRKLRPFDSRSATHLQPHSYFSAHTLSCDLRAAGSAFKSKGRLEAENTALRHQLTVQLILTQLYRSFPSVLKAITIIRAETLVRWHRVGFRRYWRWKSRSLGGRPQIDADLRLLIRQRTHRSLDKDFASLASGSADRMHRVTSITNIAESDFRYTPDDRRIERA
jgi:hypothetical protein